MRVKEESGFTLIEISIVLTILALLISSGLVGATAVIKTTKLNDTRERLDAVVAAVKEFQDANGFLPCPARRDSDLDSSGFGVSTDCSASSAGVSDVDLTGTSGTDVVRIGVVPVRSLNLASNLMFDAWGGRFLYAATKNLATTVADYDNVANLGQISIEDSAGITATIPAGQASYMIVSHGLDGKGAYDANAGNLQRACGASANLDVENCDEDSKFRDTLINEGNTASAFYDDVTAWGAKEIVLAGGGGGSSGFPTGTLFLSGSDTDGQIAVGNPGGYMTGHAACNTISSGARMASVEDVIKHVPSYSLAEDGWLIPYQWSSGQDSFFSDCSGYTSNSAPGSQNVQGTILDVSTGDIVLGDCDSTSIKIVCFLED